MSDIRVDGYSSISFWREDEIGVIVLRTGDDSMLNTGHVSELITSLGTAAMDDNVRAVAITGINLRFAKGLDLDNSADLDNIMQYGQALLSLVYSIEKPIFTIIGGEAIDAGYEIALMGDVLLASRNNEVGFNKSYTFMLGGSITSSRFRCTDVAKASAGSNVDLTFDQDKLLDDAKQYISEHADFDYPLIRKRRMMSLRESLLEEREHLRKRVKF